MIFEELIIGKTTLGKDITAFKNQFNAHKYLYLLAGVHGDEPEGVFVLEQLFSWLKNNPSIARKMPLIVIPCLNLDGLEQETRVNANGVDLNRNLPTKNWSPDFNQDRYFPGSKAMSEIENILLDQTFQKYPPASMLNFHTWKPILNYDGKACKKIAEFLSSFNHYPVAETIGYETPGSLGTYLLEKYLTSSLTLEFPEKNDQLSVENIWQENEKGLKELFQGDLLNKLF